MLLQRDEKLAERIVRILSREPGLETGSLLARVNAGSEGGYSAPALYKSLAKLAKEGVVVRTGKKYFLHLGWALQLMSFAEELSQNYLAHCPDSEMLPDPGEARTWQFSNVLDFRNFWGSAALRIIKRSDPPHVFSWNPHPWYHLFGDEKSLRTLRILRQEKIMTYKVVGGGTPLDKWCAALWDKDSVNYSFAKSPFHHERRKYINLARSYALTATVPKSFAQSIDTIFRSTRSMEELVPSTLFQLLNVPFKGKVRIENDTPQARTYQRQFKAFFGVK